MLYLRDGTEKKKILLLFLRGQLTSGVGESPQATSWRLGGSLHFGSW